MQAIVGAAYSVTFDIIVDGEYAVPDSNETKYTLYDNAGAAMAGHTDVAVSTGAAQTQVTISIPGAQHTVAGGKSFERRALLLTTKVAGKTYQFREPYYVTPYLNFTVSRRDVITLLGIREGEVLEPDVDLVTAYFKVLDSMGSTLFSAALTAGDIRQIKVNEAIKGIAALALMRTIEMRALKKLGGDAMAYTRFDGIDFDKLRANIAGMVQDAISEASGTDLAAPTAFIATTPVDPITGV